MPCLIGQCIEAHLLDHGNEAVAAGGREMLLEAYLFYEVEVGIGDVFGCVAGENLDQEADDTLDDEGVALGLEHETAFGLIGMEPYAALTALDLANNNFRISVKEMEKQHGESD